MSAPVRRFRLTHWLLLLAVSSLAVVWPVPLWIDRLGLRERVALQLGQVLGRPVQVDGPTRWRWLPSPRLVFGPVASTAGVPAIRARELEVVLGLRPLVGGLRLLDGRLDWGAPAGAPGLSLGSPELRLAPAPVPGAWSLTGDLQPSADGLAPAGPWTLAATFRVPADGPGLVLDGLRLSGIALRLGQGAPSTPGLTLELTARGYFDSPTGTLTLSEWRLTSAGLAVSGAATLGAGPAFEGRLSLAPMDLRDWLGRQGFAPIPGAADRLRRVTASAEVAGGLTAAGPWLRVQQGRLRLDDTLAAFSSALSWPAARGAALPLGQVTLAVDALDLDAYLHANPAAAATGTATDLAGAPPEPPAAEPTGAEAGALQLRLSAAALRFGGPVFRQMTLTGVLTPTDLGLVAAAELYGGRLEARGTLIPPPVAPAPELDWTLSGQATGVDLGALLADLPGLAPILTGTAGASFTLTGRGQGGAALRNGLAGRVALAVVGGTIPGLDLDGLLAQATGRTMAGGLTRFDRLSVSATGRDGRFVSTDIDGAAPRVRLTGEGVFDVPAATVDLGLRATLVRPPDGSGIRELEGIPIPISVRGPWTAPQWQVDLGGALAEAARRALERPDGNVLDGLERQLGLPGLREGLQRLFGR